MKIKNIKYSGSSNVLQWAINQSVDLVGETDLHAIVNDELFFLVELCDIDFYTLWKLSMIYRNKLRVIDRNKIQSLSRQTIMQLFPDADETDIGMVEDTIDAMVSLALQMTGDEHLTGVFSIAPSLYVPMLVTTYTIQIPLSFVDLIDYLKPEEIRSIFGANYPQSISLILEDGKCNDLKNKLYTTIVQMTPDILYPVKYDQLISVTKYFPLAKESGVCKAGLLAFHAFDKINRGEIKCNMFKPVRHELEVNMQRLGPLVDNLEFDFAVQMPIEHACMLETLYDPEIIKINYRSSATNLLDNGILSSVTPIVSKETSSDESIYDPAEINAYAVRIAEANHKVLSCVNKLLSKPSVDKSTIFAILPKAYLSNAVITISYADICALADVSHPAEPLREMFSHIYDIAQKIISGIKK